MGRKKAEYNKRLRNKKLNDLNSGYSNLDANQKKLRKPVDAARAKYNQAAKELDDMREGFMPQKPSNNK